MSRYDIKRETLEKKLSEARKINDWKKVRKIMGKIETLDTQFAVQKRIRYAELTKRDMTAEEVNDFVADIVEMAIIGSLATDVTMRVEKHLCRWKEFESPDLVKFSHAIKILNQSTSVINETSKSHPIVDENGNVYSLNDHFGEMVDEAETYMLGYQNKIRQIVKKGLHISAKDLEEYHKNK